MPKKTTNEPLVSIVVPFHNTEDTIEECIKSILCQSYPSIELILVNDGSDDRSASICEQYAKSDNRLTILEQKQSGVSVARNNGILRASGEWILFVDADDVITEDCCKDLVAHIRDDVDIVVGFRATVINGKKVYRPDPKDYEKEKEFATLNEKKKYCKSIFNNFSGEKQYPHAAFVTGKMFKRQTVMANEVLFDKDLAIYEDAYFTMKMIGVAKKIVWINKPVYVYRISKKSSTQGYTKKTVLEYEAAHSKIFSDESLKCLYDEADKQYMAIKDLNQILKNIVRTDIKTKQFKKIIKELVSSEPYAEAVKCVNIKHIPKLNKALVVFSRLHLISAVAFAYKIERKKGKI